MARALDLHAGDGIIATDGAGGRLAGFGTTVPGAVAGWLPGAFFIKTSGSAGAVLYVNGGTLTSAAFVALGTAGVAPSAAPTAADASTIDTTYGQQEADVLGNVRTRLGQVIACLQAHGLMAS